MPARGWAPPENPFWVPVDNAVAFSGATGGLSTQKAAAPKLLSVRHANHTDRGTGLSAPQVAVSIDEKAVVHKKWLALLLLLFIYKTLKEQPKNILGAQKPESSLQTLGRNQEVLAVEMPWGKAKPLFRPPFPAPSTPAEGSLDGPSGQKWPKAGLGGAQWPSCPPRPSKRRLGGLAGTKSLCKGR